jgi:hypothetical protein
VTIARSRFYKKEMAIMFNRLEKELGKKIKFEDSLYSRTTTDKLCSADFFEGIK